MRLKYFDDFWLDLTDGGFIAIWSYWTYLNSRIFSLLDPGIKNWIGSVGDSFSSYEGTESRP